jgi:hypothetical protein
MVCPANYFLSDDDVEEAVDAVELPLELLVLELLSELLPPAELLSDLLSEEDSFDEDSLFDSDPLLPLPFDLA